MITDCSLIYYFSMRKIQVQNMLCPKIVFCFCFGIQNKFCTQHILNLDFSHTERKSMSNLLSYCGLTHSRMSASETNLPVLKTEWVSPLKLSWALLTADPKPSRWRSQSYTSQVLQSLDWRGSPLAPQLRNHLQFLKPLGF